jgi:Xaa-Pro aminopeptidase
MTPANTPLERALSEAGLDALLITRDANQRYLEGYTGSECYLLASPRGRWLIADSRYTEQAAQECRTATVVQHRDPFPPYAEVIAALAKEQGLKRIGFEKAVLTYAQFEAISGELTKLEDTVFQPTEGHVERLRMVKTAEEITRIRTACAISDQALQNTLVRIRDGMSELELARELESQIIHAGGDGVAFSTIAAFGARASQPHAVPDAKVHLQRGDFILLDFGALYQGYRADMTRTFVLGSATERQKSAYAAVLESQLKGIEALRPGAGGREPDAVSRQHLLDHDWPEFGYGVGHGVGLEIHELPFLSRKCDQALQPGMILTVEPGVYIPQWGGIRIEDTVLVGDSGPECLTRFPKDTLIEV